MAQAGTFPRCIQTVLGCVPGATVVRAAPGTTGRTATKVRRHRLEDGSAGVLLEAGILSGLMVQARRFSAGSGGGSPERRHALSACAGARLRGSDAEYPRLRPDEPHPAGRKGFVLPNGLQALAQAFVNQQAFQSALARPAFRLVPAPDSIDPVQPGQIHGAVQGTRSFLKKRTKKLLPIGVRLPDRPATAIQKFFASFFQKRSSFTY